MWSLVSFFWQTVITLERNFKLQSRCCWAFSRCMICPSVYCSELVLPRRSRLLDHADLYHGTVSRRQKSQFEIENEWKRCFGSQSVHDCTTAFLEERGCPQWKGWRKEVPIEKRLSVVLVNCISVINLGWAPTKNLEGSDTRSSYTFFPYKSHISGELRHKAWHQRRAVQPLKTPNLLVIFK